MSAARAHGRGCCSLSSCCPVVVTRLVHGPARTATPAAAVLGVPGCEGHPAVLDQHHAALRPVWEGHAGVEVGTEGDSFVVAFDSADDALAAAVAGQAALAAVPWRSPLPVLASAPSRARAPRGAAVTETDHDRSGS